MRGGTGKHRGPNIGSAARQGVWDKPVVREPAQLSADALSVLVSSETAPVDCRDVNPGIVRKLTSEGWATLVDVPNALWRRYGRTPRTVQALTITEKGKARIAFDEQ